jgi:hypothetical protein
MNPSFCYSNTINISRSTLGNGPFDVVYLDKSNLKLKEHLRDNHKVIFLEGEICRKELLLEIEGVLTYGY